MMGDYGKLELGDSNKNYWNEAYKTCLYDEEGEISTETENEDMIHRDINKN